MIKKVILFYSIILFLVSLLWNCSRKSRNIESEDTYKTETIVEEQLKRVAYQTLNSWLDEGIEGVQFLRSSEWKIGDPIFLNSSNDKGYLLLLNQDKASKAELDYVQVLYGVKQKEGWNIYLESLPNLVIPRKKVNGSYIINTFDQLAAAGAKEIGMHLKKDCWTNNDECINKELNSNLIKNHQSFLSRKIKN